MVNNISQNETQPLHLHDGPTPHRCCQFVPSHILQDLRILNGVTFSNNGSSVASSSRTITTGAHLGGSPQKVVKVELTMQFFPTFRIISTQLMPSIPRTTMSGARATSATTTAATPDFPVYDLDGATDLQDNFGIPEYKRAISTNSRLPEATRSTWPSNALRAAETAEEVYQFFKDEFRRNSINDAGMNIQSCVRLRTVVVTYDARGNGTIARDGSGSPIKVPENNAFWDGAVMAYGEGDGMIFNDFTASEDVVAHELTHGVTDYTCKLRYQGQSGALNEHISDVFGVIFRHKKQGMDDPSTANWLIGDDCIDDDFKKMVETRRFGHWHALRSMKAPGTAYAVTRGSSTGRDRQPAHMDQYQTMTADNGGVHINSGIPNRAFYLFSIKLGSPSWKIPGQVWYQTITSARFGTLEQDPNYPQIRERVATFKEFALATIVAAQSAYSSDVNVTNSLTEAWREVGVL